MPSQASVIRHAPAPAASNTRVAGEKPTAAMLSRATFSTASEEQLKRVVVRCPDMADRADVGRHRLVVPATAAQQERLVRAARGGVEEERLDPRLPVRQAVGEEGEVRPEPGVGSEPEWWVAGIERVVNRHAPPRAQRRVGVDDRRPAAVGQHEVKIASGQRRIGWPGSALDGGEGRGRVDVHKGAQRAGPGMAH